MATHHLVTTSGSRACWELTAYLTCARAWLKPDVLFMELFSPRFLSLGYSDSEHAHTVTHPRLCTLPLLPDGKGSPNRQDLWPPADRESAQGEEGTQSRTGGEKTRGGTQGLIKELFNFGEHSFEAASNSYPALHFLASDPFSLNAHSAPSFSSSLSLQPLHVLASLSSKSDSLGLLSSNCIFL